MVHSGLGSANVMGSSNVLYVIPDVRSMYCCEFWFLRCVQPAKLKPFIDELMTREYC